jgi:hypothetical protein
MGARGESLRVTISLDSDAQALLENLKKELKASRSEVIRRSLRFYSENKHLLRHGGRIKSYLEMLSGGEHIILDIDHWQLFLNFIEGSKEKEKFWEGHKRVARSHGEQFRGSSLGDILERLEACNFYTLRRVSEEEFILVMNFEPTKKFVKAFLEEVFAVLEYRVEIKDDLAKLRIKAL